MIKVIQCCCCLLCLVSCQIYSPNNSNTTEQVISSYPVGLTAAQLTEQCQTNLDSATTKFQALATLTPPYTVKTLLKPMEQLFVDIDNATGMTFLLSNVHPDEDLRAVADTCIQDFSNVLTNIGLSKPLYDRLTHIDASEQDPGTLRYLSDLLSDFKRSGVNKNDQQRERIRAINEDIIALGQQFSKNIREDIREIKLNSVDQLQGLPDDYIAQHQPDSNGNITITTDYPDFFPFLRYAHDDEARLSLYKNYLNRGYPNNEQVLKNIIIQRDNLAKALDYPNFARYATEDMMTKNPTVVSEFIDRIAQLTQSRSERDYKELLAALRIIDNNATSVGNWQKSYLEEIVRREQYDVDTKLIREYFQYDKVRQGIFELVEDLFGVEIRSWETPSWHSSVEAYEILENDQVIGRFYLDMHPRPDKYKHAAQFGIQSGLIGRQLPMAALVCNFSGGDDTTALMEHRQVETFLHEFGHLIHSIFGGQQNWGSFSGVATERDFVEAPSQMLEEWVWDYDTLKSFAINQQGEVIPEQLVNKMRKARSFGRGIQIRNQMFYAALSLAYYQTPPEQLDLTSKMIDLQQQYSPFAYIDDTHFYSSFGHLYGYSAAYYTYMWSEVIAADILKQFKQQGMRNTDLAAHYRKTVLAPGGSKDAAELIEDFLGRPFNFDAFIERLNEGY